MDNKPIGAGKSSFELIDEQLLFAELALGRDSIFLDLGCGAGFYSLAAAKRIGSDGEIFAYDLWPEAILALNTEIEIHQIKQIQACIADVTKSVPLEDGSVDTCLLATVLHDFVSLRSEKEVLLEVVRVLKPGGILAVVEFKVLDGPPGPPKEVRMEPVAVRELLASFGLTFMKSLDLGPFNYLSLFRRQ